MEKIKGVKRVKLHPFNPFHQLSKLVRGIEFHDTAS